jgi:hypothetical protein
VQSTTFLELPESPLSDNHNAGGGKRIFPDKLTPNDPIDRSIVKVKAKISVAQPNVNVYFKSFDIDEPSTDSLPIDINGNSNGNDNRGFGGSTIYCSSSPLNPCPLSSNAVEYATTDSNGEVVVYISVRSANPGDNFAVAASTKETEIRQASVYGLVIKDSTTNRTLQIGADRTDMLTVWRKLHIEIDSMGIVQNNSATAKFREGSVVGNESVTLSAQNFLDSGRFQGGRLLVGNDFLEVDKNNITDLVLHSPFYPVTVVPRRNYTLYDDDDFNSDNGVNGFDADNGEDITALPDSFNLMQENDDTSCSDGYCNVYAAAYIEPEYSWANPYNTSDIPFVQNVPYTFNAIENQVTLGRNSDSSESDEFWVVYVQIAYQGGVERDCDDNNERCLGGVTPNSIFIVNDVTQESQVPDGSQGSLAFIEVMKDFNIASNGNYFGLKVMPHEIGHQFGISGDDSEPGTDFGLMGASNGLTFIDRHLNVIRWRKKSPGVARN